MAQGGYGGGGGYGGPPGGGAPPGYGAPPGGMQPTADGGYGAQVGYGAPPGQAPSVGYGQPAAPQQAWGAQPALGVAGGGGYEFNAPENDVIGRAGSRAAIWGTISIIGGCLLAIAGIVGLVLGIIAVSSSRMPAAMLAGAALMGGGLVALTMSLQPLISGKFYIDAGRALKSVVETQGNDIAHMIDALGKLRNAVRLEAIVAIIAFLLGILMALVVVGLLVAGMR